MSSAGAKPGTGPEEQFADRLACERWLGTLDHEDIDALLTGIQRQVSRITRRAMEPRDRYEVLEALRPVLIEALRRHVASYSIGSVPLGPAYEIDWERAVELLRSTAAAYQRCLQEASVGAEAGTEIVSVACARCLQHISAELVEHFRVYRKPPSSLWRELHQLFVVAEGRACVDTIVADPHLPPYGVVNCGRAYARALLFDLANPGGLPARHFTLLDSIVDQAVVGIEILRERGDRDAGALVAVDIASEAGVRLEVPHTGHPNLRYLDVGGAARRVRATLSALRGETPADGEPFDLGAQVPPGEALGLLERLQLQWHGGMRGRAHRREHASNTAHVCVGIRSIHYFAGLRRLEEDLQLQPRPEAFDEPRDMPTEPLIDHTLPAFGMDEWQVLDRSPGGFGLRRNDDGPSRVAHNGIVGLLAPSDEGLLLGVVAWMSQDPDRSLRFGVSFIPGRPSAVSVRAEGGDDHFEPALVLGGAGGMGEHPSVILPVGWFVAGAVLDVYSAEGEAWKIELTRLVQRGGDFERVEFRRR